MSLDAHSFLSTSLNSLMGWVVGVVLIGHATSNGHGCADYEQPLREGRIGGRYELEMVRGRLGD